MEIRSVCDGAFRPYGQVLEGYDLAEALAVLEREAPMIPDGTVYVPSVPALESQAVSQTLRDRGFGGLEIQFGYCSGSNRALTCLEYHRTSEIDIAATDMILLLARQQELEDFRLDTSRVRGFFLPRGTAVELFATTLHYAPCGAEAGRGFQMGCVLPRGTNGPRPDAAVCGAEDRLLWGRNKWVIASEGTEEASQGAFVGIRGAAVEL